MEVRGQESEGNYFIVDKAWKNKNEKKLKIEYTTILSTDKRKNKPPLTKRSTIIWFEKL